MKKLVLVAALVAIVVIVSCSNPGGGGPTNYPPVTQADSQQAVTAMGNAQSYANAGYSSWGYTVYGQTISATGPHVALTITFYPTMAAFAGPGSSYAVMTETITNYHDATTGYTVSGTLTCTMNCYNNALTTFVYSGNLNFSGPGNVRTMTMNLTLNYTTFTYTGTVTVNGQTFTY